MNPWECLPRDCENRVNGLNIVNLDKHGNLLYIATLETNY
jgi:hypothetical protein